MMQSASSSFGNGPILNTASPDSDCEETAFQSWLTRRDAARSQIRRLSRRELQVVQLVSNGLANKSIALQLEISVKTIEKHRANAARKLGVGSTAEMVRLAVLADHDTSQQLSRLTAAAPHGILLNNIVAAN